MRGHSYHFIDEVRGNSGDDSITKSHMLITRRNPNSHNSHFTTRKAIK